jgi:hypothetical protein
MAALPGGWIADRLIGAQRAVMIGGALMTLGSLMLTIPGPKQLFFGGLVVIILGVGLLKPNFPRSSRPLPEGGGGVPATIFTWDQPRCVHRAADRRLARAAVRLAHRLPGGGHRHATRAYAVLAVAGTARRRGCIGTPARWRQGIAA